MRTLPEPGGVFLFAAALAACSPTPDAGRPDSTRAPDSPAAAPSVIPVAPAWPDSIPLPVNLVIGDKQITVDIGQAYADTALRKLPRVKPLKEEPHEGEASGKRYCFSFAGGFMTFMGDDFGSRVVFLRKRPAEALECAPLGAIPRIDVGSKSITLDMPTDSLTLASLPKFGMGQKSFTREWRYSDGRYCSIVDIVIEADTAGGRFEKIDVLKTGEGDTTEPLVRPGTRDTIQVCARR